MGGTFSVKEVTARAELESTGFGDVDRAPRATLDQMTGLFRLGSGLGAPAVGIGHRRRYEGFTERATPRIEAIAANVNNVWRIE